MPLSASSAILRASVSGLTWYGSSEITSMVRPRASSSTSTTARMVTEPRPVR